MTDSSLLSLRLTVSGPRAVPTVQWTAATALTQRSALIPSPCKAAANQFTNVGSSDLKTEAGRPPEISPAAFYKCLRMVLMAPFSSRLTCACEIPISEETSICVFPS